MCVVYAYVWNESKRYGRRWICLQTPRRYQYTTNVSVRIISSNACGPSCSYFLAIIRSLHDEANLLGG